MTAPTRRSGKEPTRVPRTHDEMSAQTKKALIDAAIKLFSTKGYGMTGMQELTKEAGVTKGALYHHFSGKEDLLKVIHDDITSRVIDALRPVVEAGDPPPDTIRALLQVHIGAVESMGDAIGIVQRERRAFGPKNWKAIRAQRSVIEGFYVETITAGQREGVFRADVDPKIIAYGVLGMMAWVTEWYRPGGASLSEIARMYADTLLGGLQAG